MTNYQVIAIKSIQRRLGLDDASYRTILRNLAGVESCKTLSNESYEQVMAFLEEQGACRIPPVRAGSTPTYWRDKVATGGGRMAYKIHALFTNYQELVSHLPIEQQYKLPGLCARFGQGVGGPACIPEHLNSQQQWQLIEALKAIIARLEDAAPTAVPVTAAMNAEIPF